MTVLVGISIPAQTSWPRSKLRREGFIKSGLELKQVRKQELMQRPWRDASYWLASPGLFSLLSIEPKSTSPKLVPPTRALPTWSLIEKMPHSWSHGGTSPTEPPFSVITPTCVKLTHKARQYNWPLVNLTHKYITIKPQPLLSYSSPRSKLL